jgi:hypothetical protein
MQPGLGIEKVVLTRTTADLFAIVIYILKTTQGNRSISRSAATQRETRQKRREELKINFDRTIEQAVAERRKSLGWKKSIHS